MMSAVCEISGQEVSTSIISKNNKGLTIIFTTNMPGTLDEDIEGSSFTQFTYTNTGTLTEAGLPALPVWVKYIKIPHGSRISLSEKLTGITIIKDKLPYPYQRPQLRNQESKGGFYYDTATYQANTPYPSAHGYINRIFVMGNNRFAELHFAPLQYDAIKQTLVLASQCELYISFKNVSRGDDNKAGGPMLITDDLGNRFDFPVLLDQKAVPFAAPRMLIVAHDNFYQSMLPFVEWKNLSGIQTTLTRLSAVGAHPSPEEIRDFIRNKCIDSLTGQILFDHLLLVGDVNYIPAFHGVRDALNDHGYSLLNAGDFFSDIFVGRFSVNSVEECQTYVDKTIKYEKYPQVELTNGWFNKASIIASNAHLDDAHGRHLVGFMKSNKFSVTDDLRASLGKFTNYNILQAINNGRSWVFYIGHGDNNGWNTLGTFNSYFLQHNSDNYFQLPAIVSVACSNADLDKATPSFAEVWMSDSREKGSIAFIGATEDTPFYLSDTLGKYSLMSYISEKTLTLGEALVYGKLMMNACFPENTYRETEETMQHFLLLGDPTLAPWTDIPQYISVDCPQFLKRGHHSLRIQVNNGETPVPYALVCLSHATNGYYKTAFTDSAGNANFVLDGNDSGYFRVAVTGRNLLPFIDSFLVTDADGLPETRQEQPIIFPHPVRAESIIQIPVKTNGQSVFRLYSLTGKLVQEDYFYGSSFLFHRSLLHGGMYLFTIQNEESLYSGKLVIQE